MGTWVRACAADAVEPEDVIPVEIDGRDFAIYRSPDGSYYATDGRCTHQRVLLADGLVMGHQIECPKHNGRFDYTTGVAQRTPVTVDLCTYPVNVEDGSVFIDIEAAT